MGELKWLQADRRYLLGSDNVLGTDPVADVCLDGREASRLHARISWHEDAWQLRDLGSRNGTFLNGVRLQPGKGRALAVGDQLGLGTEEPSLVLSSAARPPASATAPDSTVVVADGQFLFLPSPDDPVVTVFQAEDGDWRAEVGGVVIPVTDGSALEVQGIRFHLSLGSDAAQTWEPRPAPLRLATAALEFTVSADEEQIRVVLRQGEHQLELPPRSYHYLLLLLARLRLSDLQAGHAPRDCGWVDRDSLCEMLRCSRLVLNKHVSRARHQLAALGVVGAREIVEVWGEKRRIGVDELVLR